MSEREKYECSVCHGVFEKGWSDEEAAAERDTNWPDFTPEDCDICCDDCHQQFMKWCAEQGITTTR